MNNTAKVSSLPDCDICQDGTKANYDARMKVVGAWASLCEVHFKKYGEGLGTGLGQELILKATSTHPDDCDCQKCVNGIGDGRCATCGGDDCMCGEFCKAAL